MRSHKVLSVILLCLSVHLTFALDIPYGYSTAKTASFVDPHTGYLYQVTSYNATSMTTESTHRSEIKVSRVKLSGPNKVPVGEPENIQTITFHPNIVDFDLNCGQNHCYMVVVTSRTNKNVVLYSWQRVQFDEKSRVNSFARPHRVKLFKIGKNFYIAIAQEQLHLSPIGTRFYQDYEDPSRFIGCAVLKFSKGREDQLKYHQFIRLPMNPNHVSHQTTINQSNLTPSISYYLTFRVDQKWSYSFVWSPLDDYFWPYSFPTAQVKPVESCFTQLQQVLNERSQSARKLTDATRSLWRSPQEAIYNPGPTNISAQVIVQGRVIVKGSLIESPQITLIGQQTQFPPNLEQISKLASIHSPSTVENWLKQAFYKLKYARDKLYHAITVLPSSNTTLFNSRIRFFAPIAANRVIFAGHGISNSNVRINGLPFAQLEHELVSLRGRQDIAAKVLFRGSVTADLLEIHGTINELYRLKDAVDITSRRVQVIEALSYGPNVGRASIEFDTVSAPELIFSHNATINGVRLDEFITNDNRTQVVFGRKLFGRLSAGQLSLAHRNVLLNGFNISRLATNALYLRDPRGRPVQFLNGPYSTFSKPIHVNRLVINSMLNGRINISALIYDSVKTQDIGQQQISGHKHFLSGLKIAQLTTDGSINGVKINQVFNLNPTPPTHDYLRYLNSSMRWPSTSLEGYFTFQTPVTIGGNLYADLVNQVDISRRAIRRVPLGASLLNSSSPQVVSGKKIFFRPLRVTDRIKLLTLQQLSQINRNTYPLINGIDMRLINEGISRHMKNPSVIYIDNLEIDGNLNLNTAYNNSGPPRTTFGNHSVCPLDVIRERLVQTGVEEQFVTNTVRVNSIRARSVQLDNAALNGINFPGDFVLRSKSPSDLFLTGQGGQIEPVFGHKTFDRIIVLPPFTGNHNNRIMNSSPSLLRSDPRIGLEPTVIVGNRFSVNNITFNELQTFIAHERQRNSTGETVYQALTVYGNITARRINGYHWPDDILLKSLSANRGPVSSPYIHRRIYSPLIFINGSGLIVENQLVLRGPVQLAGRLNGVNLTDFARQSVTHGDKDLYSVGRPIKNKIFTGGISVINEIRSQGLIGGVNIDELRNRAVTIHPNTKKIQIRSPKIFMSDVNFLAPVNIAYVNDLLLDNYLRRLVQQTSGDQIRIFGKKTLTGTLKINKNLLVQGSINKINFIDLRAQAIRLSPPSNEIQFNKTLTIEGNVVMDNLLIDEKDGMIDGVKLTNLLPIDSVVSNELVISDPVITQPGRGRGLDGLSLEGLVNDCKITCSLVPPELRRPTPPPLPYARARSMPFIQFQQVTYPPRQIVHNGRNLTYMRTTPPYVTEYRAPQMQQQVQQEIRPVIPSQKVINKLANRPPAAIQYEYTSSTSRQLAPAYGLIPREYLTPLRKQIVSLNLIQVSNYQNLIVGFIESPTTNIGNLFGPDLDEPHSDHAPPLRSFLLLDQVDYRFSPIIYHLSVGVTTVYGGLNSTKVISTVGASEPHQISELPIESPNSAMFLRLADDQALFLLVSQDYTVSSRRNGRQCPIKPNLEISAPIHYAPIADTTNQVLAGVHVYLFHALQNSSSLSSAYFDLYQTLNLAAIDRFESFHYYGSTYAVAISRMTSRIYLLLLRGYSGFQIVSHIEVPLIERVKVVYSADQKPMLIIFQTNGFHTVLESVVI